ncbi:hypothetical protein AAC387_Pa09g0545 [Persea americana]
MQGRKHSRKGLVSTPRIMPNVNVLTITNGPSTTLMNEVGKAADSLPNTRTIESVYRIPNVAVLEVAIFKPSRPDGVHCRSLPAKLDERHYINFSYPSNAKAAFHLWKGNLRPVHVVDLRGSRIARPKKVSHQTLDSFANEDKKRKNGS